MSTNTDRDLVLTRTIDASPEKVYACWTTPELMKQWFAPKPFTTPVVEIDVRPGGRSHIVMRSPEGEDAPNPGTFLEVVPNRKLVFTDAFTEGFTPSEGAPFMVATIELEPLEGGKKTKYTATARHWTAEAAAQHKEMGFHDGWGQAADQLEALAKTLP